jgi:hypothetical protein
MNVRVLLVTLALAALVAGCGGSSPAPGRVRALNAVQGATSVDLLLDGSLAVGAISLPGSSGYQSRPPGTYAASLVLAGTSTPVAMASIPLTSGESTTFLGSGVLGGSPAPAAVVLLDDDSPPAAGQARLRVVHACAGLAGVPFAATLRPMGSPTPAAPTLLVPFRTGAYFLEFPAGAYSVEILDDATGLLLITFSIPLAAGSSSTVLLSDADVGAQAPVRASIFGDLP